MLSVILIVALVYGCLPSNTYKIKGVEKKCRPYYKFIRHSFRINDEGVYGYITPPDYDHDLPLGYHHVNKSCICGLSKRQIVRLFGIPSLEKKQQFHYFNKKECFQEGDNRPGCARIIIRFDENGIAKKVSLPNLEIPPMQ